MYRRRDDYTFDTLPPSAWKTELIRQIQAENAMLKHRSCLRAATECLLWLVAFCLALGFLDWLPVSPWATHLQLTMSGAIPSPARAHFSER
jgi:hypothetical protein